MTQRRVYVVELSDDAGPRRNRQYANVYVGETGESPQKRFEKHKAGGQKASNVVRKYGLRLLPDLYEHLPAYATERESVAAEKLLKAELELIGYRVWGGGSGLNESFAKRNIPSGPK